MNGLFHYIDFVVLLFTYLYIHKNIIVNNLFPTCKMYIEFACWPGRQPRLLLPLPPPATKSLCGRQKFKLQFGQINWRAVRRGVARVLHCTKNAAVVYMCMKSEVAYFAYRNGGLMKTTRVSNDHFAYIAWTIAHNTHTHTHRHHQRHHHQQNSSASPRMYTTQAKYII